MTNPILTAFAGDQASENGPQSAGNNQAVFKPYAIRTRLADVAAEDVRWLWPGRIPYGKLTLLVGDPRLGKSFMTLDMAARLSTATPWPDRQNAPIEPGIPSCSLLRMILQILSGPVWMLPVQTRPAYTL